MKLILKSLYQNSKNIEFKKLVFDAFNKSVYTRELVTQNINTPASILEFLSNDKNRNVRYYIALNPNTPIHVLKKLSNDENKHISKIAFINLKNKKLKIYETHY